MTDYDIELTLEANVHNLMVKICVAPWDPWLEAQVLKFMVAAYLDGYDQARFRWLARNEIPEVDL